MTRAAPGAERKTILLTGASTGLGLALARGLLDLDRYRLVLTARPSSLERFADAGLREGPHLLLRPLDVTDPAARRAVVAEIDAEWGGVDVLINNAGVTYRTVAEYATSAELMGQMAINYEAPMALAALVIPRMRKRGEGRILQLSSAGGIMAMPTMGLYAASKFALEAASEAMHYELRPFGVRVTLVIPGFIRSRAFEKVLVGAPSQAALDNPSDPYHHHFTHMNRFIARAMRLARATNESVARKVVRAVQSRRPPLRLIASWDARLLWWFRRYAPQPLYIWTMYRLLPGIGRWGEFRAGDTRRF